MNKVNRLVICKDEYNSKEEFELAIKDAAMVLLNNNYVFTVRYDEKALGIVVIEFESANRHLCDHYPYWLTPEEADSVQWENEE